MGVNEKLIQSRGDRSLRHWKVVTKRDARLHAMLLVRVRVQMEWLYWQRRTELIRSRRISKREARDECAAQLDESADWQKLLELELRDLARHHGLVSVPKVSISHHVPNAASDGLRIHMNPVWAEQANALICGSDHGCTRALVRGIAAHELAHHLREEAVGHPHDEELRADAWAARALSELGTSVEPYMRLVGCGPEHDSPTHPKPSRRRRVIRDAALAKRGTKPLAVDPPCCMACEVVLAGGGSQPHADAVCLADDEE